MKVISIMRSIFSLVVWQLAACMASSLTSADEKGAATAVDFKAELPRILPTEPADTIAKFRLRPGLKIELAVAEPLIRDPVAIDFDESGRMFVVEFPEYNQKHVRDEVTDRGTVRMLEDTDGDGVFDRSEIYVDELSYPSSVACYDGGVFVAAAPEILYCKDTDADGSADLRKVVFTGFGQEFQRAGQAQLNSFRWGLDNRIHVCTSFSGGAVLRADVANSKPVHVRNRGFLFDPRTLSYEAASGGGQHGLAIDDWGREFRCRNSDPFKLLFYDERYLKRNPYLKAPAPSVNILEGGKNTELFRISRDEPWRVIRTRMRTEGSFAGSNEGGKPFGFFTSATGITIYRGDAWPAEYRGSGFVGEVANNLIFRAKFEPKGVGLVAKRADREAEFVASTDNWFRPVQFANGPDGALYVVDMYRELIEGASFLPPEVLKHINVVGGVNRGRIYRIVPDDSDFRRRVSPTLGQGSTAELVGLLQHRNGWHRDTAARLIYTRQDMAAVEPLKRLARQSALPEGRLHALYALDGLDELDEPTVAVALADSDSRVRRHAVRFAERFVADSPVIQQKILDSAEDPDLLVRFQSAFSLGSWMGSNRDDALARLVRSDGEDLYFRLAILSSIGAHRGEMLTVLLADQKLSESKHGQLLLTELASQIGMSGEPAEVQSLVKAIEDLRPAQSSLGSTLIRRAVADASSPIVAEAITSAGDQAAKTIAGLFDTARRRAVDTDQREATRVSSIRLLRHLKFPEIEQVVHGLLDVQQPRAVQFAAVELLGKQSDAKVASLLLERWRTFSPELRAQVFETLSSREEWLGLFLDAVEENDVGRGDVDPARLQLLKAHPNETIRQRTAGLFSDSDFAGRRQDAVQAYQPALLQTGEPKAGKEHFRRVCSACHRLENVGTAVGADLKAIRSRGMAAIMLNILDPNREVKPQYLTYTILTTDGRVLTGMIQSESANSITVRRPDGTNITILRIDIEEMRSTGLSFMPEGIEETLDQQAMADLLAYLSSIE